MKQRQVNKEKDRKDKERSIWKRTISRIPSIKNNRNKVKEKRKKGKKRKIKQKQGNKKSREKSGSKIDEEYKKNQ